MPMARASVSSSRSGSASLSNVVSSLVRAQYGLAAKEDGRDSTETDLDRHVAELLLKEAKEREERAKRDNGWRFSDDEDGDGSSKQFQSKTNKRFLKNLMRGVEDHNAPLRREEVVTKVSKRDLNDIRRREREEREQRTGIKDMERPHRHTERYNSREPVENEDCIASTSTLRHSSRSDPRSTARKDGPPGFAARALAIGLSGARNARRQEDRRNRDIQDAVQQARSRASASGTDASGRGKSVDREGSPAVDGEYTRLRGDHRRTRRRSASPIHRERFDDAPEHGEPLRSFREVSPTYAERKNKDYTQTSRSAAANKRSRRHSRSPSSSGSRSRSESASRTGSDDDHFVDYTGQAGQGGSKMDKYFDKTYNPALDISVQDLTDPATGLIAEGNFSGWDHMLSVLKQRKEDQAFGVTRAREEERERQLRKLERKQRRDEREVRRAARRAKKRKYASDSDDYGSESTVGPKKEKRPISPVVKVINGYEYGTRGSTRAWDLGKESTPS